MFKGSIGDYNIHRSIGKGASCKVYIGYKKKDTKAVAIKMMFKSSGDSTTEEVTGMLGRRLKVDPRRTKLTAGG